MYKKVSRGYIKKMCIQADSTIRQAMKAIGKGKHATVFIVENNSDKFLGLVTDGDIRRALLGGHGLETNINLVAQQDPRIATIKMAVEEIANIFSDKIRVIPIIDTNNRIVDVAFYDQRIYLPVTEPILEDKELLYVTECIITNWVSSSGKFVNRFENIFADYCGSCYAISTCNGTAALHLALLAVDIQPGDEVIIPSLTFIATANAVTYTGASPILVDSESETWNIDPTKVEAAITPNTKAIIIVHLYGHPADMDPILKIAQRYKLTVIEDAAEAHGAKYKGKYVGGIGDIGTFSFYGNKIITTGEGGMVVTNDKDIAAKIKILRDHGMSTSRRYWHPFLGYNYRLTNIQAALGVAQMERIDNIIESKLEIAEYYGNQLKNCKGITLPPHAKWAKNVYWLYSIVLDKDFGISRDQLIKELGAKDIDTRPLFPPIHTQPIYNTGQKLEVSEKLSDNGLSLPSSTGLQKYEIDRICNAITSIK